jgi:hypothetical protein
MTETLTSTIEEYKHYVETNSGFTRINTANNINVYQCTQQPGIIKGSGVLKNITARQFADVIINDNLADRRKWDTTLNSFKTIKTLDNTRSILYAQFNSPSITVSNRDFVFIREERIQDNVIDIVSTSIKDGYPAQKGVVRGWIKVSWWRMKPVNETDLEVTRMDVIDLNGWIPTAIVNRSTQEKPLTIATIAKILGKTLVTAPSSRL